MSDEKPSRDPRAIAELAALDGVSAESIERWFEWRAREDERMYAELEALLVAWLELREHRDAGGTLH